MVWLIATDKFFLCQDPSTNQMAQIAMGLGDFRNLETPCEHYNGNGILRLLYYHQLNDEDRDLDFLELPPYDTDFFDKVESLTSRYYKMFQTVDLGCNDAALLKAEYQLSFRFLFHGIMLGKYRQQGIYDRAKLWELYDDIQTIIADYRKGYLARNRNLNFENSVFKLHELQRQYQQALGVDRVKV